MFTWICPQCGKEVPPAYTDCPNCAEKAAQGGKQDQPPPMPAAQPTAPPPQYQPQAQYQPPPQYQPQAPPPPPYAYPPQQQPQYPPPPPGYYMPPQPKKGLPTWLLTILVAAGTTAVIAGVIWLLSNNHESKPSSAVESPAAKPGLATNPIQRNVEVSGLRFSEDPKRKGKTIVRFLVINHSGMDLTGLAGNVTMWGSTRKSDEDAQGTFTFALDLHPFESREQQATLNTKFKIYEMPDWQSINPDVQITAPVISGGSGAR